jgi:hypothetical protein
MTPHRPIRIANCSGFYGDRISAAREMVEGGPIDVLTGDWLAELTMLILWKAQERGGRGYPTTFLTQMEGVLGTCVDRGIKVVSNAGGLDPGGCAAHVREIAARVGVSVSVAHLEGDDFLDRVDELRPALSNVDTGEPLVADPVTANAYLGGWGIAAALAHGADVVICPRVSDAALVVGPAAWWWNWAPTDWDQLAASVVAGHVIECGAQTTGGNFAFFEEFEDFSTPPGFPIAEIDHDGTVVITKHPRSGGRVSIETVTAQLLYEIQGPTYANPDVMTRFDTIQLHDDGPDRVRITDVRGEPAPHTAKLAINLHGGYRNKASFVLSGVAQERKARWALDALVASMGGANAIREAGVELESRFVPAPPDGPDQERSSGLLHVFATATAASQVDRAFSASAVELTLANYPGCHMAAPPGRASAFGIFWPALVPATEVDQTVALDSGDRISVPPAPTFPASPEPIVVKTVAANPLDIPPGTRLANYFGARSGDKGGNANIGVWARDDAGYAWLAQRMTPSLVRRLMPEAAGLDIVVHQLPNLRAVNIVLIAYLGAGVAGSTSFDPQAKGLGEYLRSRRL